MAGQSASDVPPFFARTAYVVATISSSASRSRFRYADAIGISFLKNAASRARAKRTASPTPPRQTPSSTVDAKAVSTTTPAGTDLTRSASLTEYVSTAAYSANAASSIASGVVGIRTMGTPPAVCAAAHPATSMTDPPPMASTTSPPPISARRISDTTIKPLWASSSLAFSPPPTTTGLPASSMPYVRTYRPILVPRPSVRCTTFWSATMKTRGTAAPSRPPSSIFARASDSPNASLTNSTG